MVFTTCTLQTLLMMAAGEQLKPRKGFRDAPEIFLEPTRRWNDGARD